MDTANNFFQTYSGGGSSGGRGSKKKPAKPKSLQTSEARVKKLQSEVAKLQKRADELRKITSNREESATAREARNAALKELAPIESKLTQKGQALEQAFQSYGTLAQNYSQTLSKSGFTKAANRFQNQATTLAKNSQTTAGQNFINSFAGGGSTGEKIGSIAGGGIAGLADVVNRGTPAATIAGQNLVGMNLGEANTALFGGQGQPGILGIQGEAAGQIQAQNTAAQGQLFQDFQNLAPEFRQGLNAISPELNRAANLANKDVNQMNRLERGTFQDTRQVLKKQQNLANRATNQAMNYKDPTKNRVATVGREMMGAARGIESIADQATQQAMNYVDPTKELAQNAIQGFQGITGLQQGAAEDAYARSSTLTPQQLRDSQQAARESFAARGMADTTGSVAAEILNREASLQSRRNEAAQLGQLAQQGQSGLTALASGYETDTLGRRTGLQQNAAGLQGMTGQAYGAAGQFSTQAETEARNRQMAMQQNAMGLTGNALAGQMGTRMEANQAQQNLQEIGQAYLGYGLPLMTNQTAAQNQAIGLTGLGLGLSGQGSGILETGTNLGMAQYTNNIDMWNARRAGDAAEDAGRMGLIGSGLGALGNAAGGFFGTL